MNTDKQQMVDALEGHLFHPCASVFSPRLMQLNNMISLPPKKEDILIVGAAGMLGRELVAAAARRGRSVVTRDGSSALDITCPASVQRCIDHLRPSIVINAAGYTNVDGAECDFEQALAVNGDGPGNLARACMEHDALLVHYSTDYVFSGNASEPYHTDDPPDPINSYGLSKLAGEKAVVSSGCRHLILRASWLFSTRGKNFVNTILRLARERDCIEVVNDQRGRPTYCPDLAELTFDLLEADFLLNDRAQTGRILHACNSGHATWHEFASHIVSLAHIPCTVRPCTSESRLLHAPRPAYSVLDMSETNAIVGRPRHWRDALRECMIALGLSVNGQANLFTSAPEKAAVKEKI